MKLADHSTGRVCALDYRHEVETTIRSVISVRGVDFNLVFAVCDGLRARQSALTESVYVVAYLSGV